jgi:hypothetical protein
MRILKPGYAQYLIFQIEYYQCSLGLQNPVCPWRGLYRPKIKNKTKSFCVYITSY